MIASAVYPFTAALLGKPIDWVLMVSVALLFGFIAAVRFVVAEFVRSVVSHPVLRGLVTAVIVFLVTVLALTAATLSGLDWRSIRNGGMDLAALTSWLRGPPAPPPPATSWQPRLAAGAAFTVSSPVPLRYHPAAVPGPGNHAGFVWSGDRYLVRWQKATGGGSVAHRREIASLAGDYAVVNQRLARWRGQLTAFLALRAPDGSPAKGRAVVGIATWLWRSPPPGSGGSSPNTLGCF